MNSIGPEEPPQQPQAAVPPVTPVIPQGNDQITQAPTNAYTPPAQEPPKKKGLSKVLTTIVLVVVTIFIAAYAGIYITLNKQIDRITHTEQPAPTPVQTKNIPSIAAKWKTLTRSNDGFLVQYPANLEPVTIVPQNQSGTQEVFWSPADQSYSFGIVIYPANANSGLEFIADKITEENVSISGQFVTKKTGNETVSHRGTLIHVGPIVSGQKSYLLFFTSGSHVAKPEDIVSFNKFITSFKLIRMAPATLTPSANSSKPGLKMCTQEARLCPDGKTYVGRTGPNCEFAACPR